MSDIIDTLDPEAAEGYDHVEGQPSEVIDTFRPDETQPPPDMPPPDAPPPDFEDTEPEPEAEPDAPEDDEEESEEEVAEDPAWDEWMAMLSEDEQAQRAPQQQQAPDTEAALMQRLKSDPVGTLKALGIGQQEINQAVLQDFAPEPEPDAPGVGEVRGQMQQMMQQMQQLAQQNQQQAQELYTLRIIDNMRTHVSQNSGELETLARAGQKGIDTMYQIAQTYYAKKQQPPDISVVAQIANRAIEENTLNYLKDLAKSSRFGKMVRLEADDDEIGNDAETNGKPAPAKKRRKKRGGTLSNDMDAVAPEGIDLSKLSKEQVHKLALKRFEEVTAKSEAEKK